MTPLRIMLTSMLALGLPLASSAQPPLPVPKDSFSPSWRFNPGTKELWISGKKAVFLAQGGMKAVYIHPENPDRIIKIYHSDILPGAVVAFFRPIETKNSRVLGEIGIGPKLFDAGITANGFYYLVTERVRGEDLLNVVREQRLTPEDIQLIKELFERLGQNNISITDLHLGNVMLGTTASVPQKRAYIVDALLIHRDRLIALVVNGTFDSVGTILARLFGREEISRAEDLLNPRKK